jgi:putative sugar O-methyltransferase
MKLAPKMYQPTKFWLECGDEIIDELETDNCFKNFKRLKTSCRYFLPIYFDLRFFDQIVNKKIKTLICNDETPKKEKYGYHHFIKNWNIVEQHDILDQKPLLQHITEEAYIGNPVILYEKENRLFSKTMLQYLKGLVYLKKSTSTNHIKNVIEIGAGSGCLGEILLQSDPEYFYVNVDIPPLSAISTWYLKQVFGDDKVAGYEELKDLENISLETLATKYRAVVLSSWQLPKVVDKEFFHLMVNMVSFQEMEPHVVQNYLEVIEPLMSLDGLILLRESVTGKKKTSNPVTRKSYINYLRKYNLIAEDAITFGNKGYSIESRCMIFSHV